MPKFNVNNIIWVKLTAKGRDMHRAHWEPYSGGNYRPPKVSIDDWSPFQMHELMHVFGPACTCTADIPFETEILLESERPFVIMPDEAEATP